MKPLWYDEICTFILVRQQRIATIWSALKQGADGQPPAFYLAERFVTPLVANERIAFRLLSILGFQATIVCLFVLIRKKRGSAVALLCASIPFVTLLYDNYAVEARPYSLVVACISFALICYERAPAIRWMIPMGLSLALAQSLSYVAMLSFLPFLAAEFVVLLEERKPRWTVWIALGSGFLPFLAFWSLLSAQQAIYGKHFWAQPSLFLAQSSYGWFFTQPKLAGEILVACAALAVLVSVLFRKRRAVPGNGEITPSLQGPTLILVILGLPFLSVFAAMLIHGGMSAHYVLPTLLGFPLAAGYVLPKPGRKSAVLWVGLPLASLAIFAGSREKSFWSEYRSSASSASSTDLVESLVKSSGHANLPVVVSDPHDFLQLAHSADRQLSARVVSVVDAPEAVMYTGSDTADKELPILQSYAALQVYDFQSFAAKNPVFLLYSGNGGIAGDWWPRKLKQDGYTLRPVGVRPRSEHDFLHRVFLVSRMKDAD